MKGDERKWNVEKLKGKNGRQKWKINVDFLGHSYTFDFALFIS